MSANNEQCTQKRNLLNDENNGTDDILKQTLNDSTTDSTQHSSDQTHPGAPVQRDQKDETESVVEQEFSFITKDEDGSIQDSTDPGLKVTTSISTGDAVEGPVPVTSAVKVESVGLTTTSTAMDPTVSTSTDVDDSPNPHAPENPNNLHKTQEDFDKKYPADVYLRPASDEPIETPTANDILFGRGGLTNHHPGNKKYREIIAEHKRDYIQAAKIIKPRVARRIVLTLRSTVPPARFLKKSPDDNFWRDVGDKAASEKTSQALREKSPEEKKASSAKKHKQNDSIAAGYSMPALSANGTFAINSTTNGFMDEMDKDERRNSEGYSIIADGPIAIYPVEGGIFGAVNAVGDIVVTEQDILLGRGGATNHHKGNKRFRDIVALHRPDYLAAPKIRKPDVSRKIVQGIRNANPPGRFLKKGDDGKWFDVGDKKAAEKASQALREKGPEARKARANANASQPYPPCDPPTHVYSGRQDSVTSQEPDTQEVCVGVEVEESLKRKSIPHDDERCTEESKKMRPEGVVDI